MVKSTSPGLNHSPGSVYSEEDSVSDTTPNNRRAMSPNLRRGDGMWCSESDTESPTGGARSPPRSPLPAHPRHPIPRAPKRERLEGPQPAHQQPPSSCLSRPNGTHSGPIQHAHGQPARVNTTAFSVLDILDPAKFTGSGTATKKKVWHPWLDENSMISNDEKLEEDIHTGKITANHPGKYGPSFCAPTFKNSPDISSSDKIFFVIFDLPIVHLDTQHW